MLLGFTYVETWEQTLETIVINGSFSFEPLLIVKTAFRRQ